jgi:hypothetical protein
MGVDNRDKANLYCVETSIIVDLENISNNNKRSKLFDIRLVTKYESCDILINSISFFIITVIPGQCTPRINICKKNRTFLINITTMDYSNYDYNARIELIIADMDAEESPVIAEVAKR